MGSETVGINAEDCVISNLYVPAKSSVYVMTTLLSSLFMPEDIDAIIASMNTGTACTVVTKQGLRVLVE